MEFLQSVRHFDLMLTTARPYGANTHSRAVSYFNSDVVRMTARSHCYTMRYFDFVTVTVRPHGRAARCCDLLMVATNSYCRMTWSYYHVPITARPYNPTPAMLRYCSFSN